MTTETLPNDVSRISTPAARLAIASVAVAVLAWITLHIVSSEFDPSWRLMSEYVNGDHAWVLGVMFFAWGAASLALAAAIRSQLATRGGKVGLALLVVSGLGQISAIVFDANHSLHGLSGLAGMGGFLVATMVISRRLARTEGWTQVGRTLVRLAHLVWISLALMIACFVLLISTYVAAGGDMSAEPDPNAELPDGTIAIIGWANRLLFLVFCTWVVVTAVQAIRIRAAQRTPAAVH